MARKEEEETTCRADLEPRAASEKLQGRLAGGDS